MNMYSINIPTNVTKIELALLANEYKITILNDRRSKLLFKGEKENVLKFVARVSALRLSSTFPSHELKVFEVDGSIYK